MNELIQKLAEESGLDARTMGVTHTAQWNARVTKLAELIVQECMESCRRAEEIRHFVPPTKAEVVESCITEIKRTFRPTV